MSDFDQQPQPPEQLPPAADPPAATDGGHDAGDLKHYLDLATKPIDYLGKGLSWGGNMMGAAADAALVAGGDEASTIGALASSGSSQLLKTLGTGMQGVGAVGGIVGGVLDGVQGVNDIQNGNDAKGGLEVAKGGLEVGAGGVAGAQLLGLTSTVGLGAEVGGAAGAGLGSAGVLGPLAGALAAGVGGGIALEEGAAKAGLFTDDSGKAEGGASHIGSSWGNAVANWIDPSTETTNADGMNVFHSGGQSTLAQVGGVAAAAAGGIAGGAADAYGLAKLGLGKLFGGDDKQTGPDAPPVNPDSGVA